MSFKGNAAVASNNIAFVTGGSGFVGSALCRLLTDRGWQVRRDPLRLLVDPAKWRAAMSSVDCVVHLAARVHQMGVDARAQAAFQETNVAGSRFVAEQAACAGVRRLVFVSSVKVNGEGGEQPYRSMDEPHPSDAYGYSKLAAERAVREVCEAAKVECVIVRPPLVYGPGVKANFDRLIKFVDRRIPLPFGSIKNKRSLVGLSNLVSFIELCMTHPLAAAKIWFIADDEPISTPDLLRKIARHLSRRSHLYPFPPAWLRVLAQPLGLQSEISRLCDSLLVDASPARNELGWTCASSLDEELTRTVAKYRAEKNR